MNCKRITKHYRKLISSPFNLGITSNGFKSGIIYTLYSDRFNLLEMGFAKNSKALENKIMRSEFILLDKENGNKRELNLLIDTLDEFGINSKDNLHFEYSNILIRHLSTLGWPVGKSLFKQRRIKKELSCA